VRRRPPGRAPGKRRHLRKQLQELGFATGVEAQALFEKLPAQAKAVVALLVYVGRFRGLQVSAQMRRAVARETVKLAARIGEEPL
jgi:hypothetical protein